MFAAVIGLIVMSGREKDAKAATTVAATAVPGASSVDAGLTVPLTTPVAETAATVPFVPLARTISNGQTGDDIRMVQDRLTQLGFVPGPADGAFGPNTRAAVWAFEKLVLKVPREQATGKVTPEMWQTMAGPVAIGPRRIGLGETHMEVYLPEQVAIVFQGDRPAMITHISSGDGEEFREVVTIDPGEDGNENGTEPLKKGIIGKSYTTGGTFTFDRRYKEGTDWKEGKLGRMYKPVYFNYGLAVHGSGNVPNKPASHGCIRIPLHVADIFPTLVKRGDWIYIWDGIKEPEEYGHQKPWFDRADPDFSTTSSTPSTSVPPSTTGQGTTTTKAPGAASTTVAATTTAAPTTTTTTTTTTLPPTTAPPTTLGGGAGGGAGGAGGGATP